MQIFKSILCNVGFIVGDEIMEEWKLNEVIELLASWVAECSSEQATKEEIIEDAKSLIEDRGDDRS